jgi:hypothetical protein
MRKQTVKLLSKCGSYVQRHLTPDQAQRMIDERQAFIVSRKPHMRVQLVAEVEASSSKRSSASLSRADAGLLASLKPGFIERLDGSRVNDMRPGTVAGLQRLAGWGLIPRNAALENYGE